MTAKKGARSNGRRNTDRVLVFDGDMTPALTVVRSLGRLGLHVTVASHEEKPLASYSRFASGMLIHPSPLDAEADFLAWCEELLSSEEFALIVPVTERTLVPLRNLPERPYTKHIALPSREALEIVLDKNSTTQIAIEEGVPAPASYAVNELEAVDAIAPQLHMPVVIKPTRSIGADEHQRKHLSVTYAFNQRELHDKVEGFLRYGNVLLQEYVAGQGVGIELIADHGKILYAFQHLRLHEVPLTGGGSSLRVSRAVEPELLEASQKLISRLAWHGVAMVEFKWNPETRHCTLMEINGRLWGSLPLAVAAGADFPAMLYQLTTRGQIEPRPPYRTDIRCRKLSSDITWHEMVWRRAGPKEIVSFPTFGSMARDWLSVLHPRHYFDVQQFRDPMPGWVDVRRIVMYHANRITNLYRERKLLRHHHRAWTSNEVKRQIGQAERVLFICYGNINRSALAEAAFQQCAPNSHIEAESAGFYNQAGRPADPTMVKVASSHGIDMTDCRSTALDADMVSRADIVFVMELAHYQTIRERHPTAANKTFLLNGDEDGRKSGFEIADPYGKPESAYETCAQTVITCVDRICKHLPG